jgi:hypothetical protein
MGYSHSKCQGTGLVAREVCALVSTRRTVRFFELHTELPGRRQLLCLLASCNALDTDCRSGAQPLGDFRLPGAPSLMGTAPPDLQAWRQESALPDKSKQLGAKPFRRRPGHGVRRLRECPYLLWGQRRCLVCAPSHPARRRKLFSRQEIEGCATTAGGVLLAPAEYQRG